MIDTYIQAMEWIAISEGGYVTHPHDRGGATNYGITQRVYHAWLKRQNKKPLMVKHITKQEVAAIYRSQYAKPIRYEYLPAGLDYALLDYAINSGVSRAVKDIQAIVGVKRDGVMGNITLAAIKDHNPVQLIHQLCNQRMRFLKRLKTWRYFGRGWTNRVMGKLNGYQPKDIGVIDRAIKLARKHKEIPKPSQITNKADSGYSFFGWLEHLIEILNEKQNKADMA